MAVLGLLKFGDLSQCKKLHKFAHYILIKGFRVSEYVLQIFLGGFALLKSSETPKNPNSNPSVGGVRCFQTFRGSHCDGCTGVCCYMGVRHFVQ